MAAVEPIRQQSYERIYELLACALRERSCISAYYHGYFRLFCPYLLGRNAEGKLQLLAFQYGGQSASGLAPGHSPDNWRCISLEKLRDVKLVSDEWVVAPAYSRLQSCVSVVELEVRSPL